MRQHIQAIPGVASVDTRVTLYATLDLPDLDAPAQVLLVSLPENSRPLLNDIAIHAGRYLAPGAENEVLINSKFAAARRLKPMTWTAPLTRPRCRWRPRLTPWR